MICIREWLFVSLLLTALITITALSFAKKHSYTTPQHPHNVFVIGAVMQEKELVLPQTATVCDLLNKVELSDDANIEALFLHQPIKNDIFIVPKKDITSIYVTGAVEKNGLYLVPAGCRYNQLLSYLPLLPEADKRFFLRKRKVVLDGDCINVVKTQKN